MPYRISFDEVDCIVSVKFSILAVKEDHYAAFKEASRLCLEHSCSNLLVDFSDLTKSRLSTMDVFFISEEIAKSLIPLRIAHVMPRPGKARENVSFASDVEANRGTPTGEFETVEQAKAWLKRNME